jgi:hypothetical protein
MLTENMFLNKINENAVYKKISNPSEWEEEILSELYKIIENVRNKTVQFEIKQEDENKGYVLGAVNVVDSDTKKSIVIPVIIKSFHLAPLDIMIVEGKAVPLTKDNFESYFFTHKVFNKTVHPKPYISSGELISNSEINYPHNSLFKAAAKFGFLSEDIKRFKDGLSKQAFLKIATTQRGAEILDLISKNEVENPKLEKYVNDHSNKKQIFMFEKSAHNKVKCFSSPTEYWHPKENDLTFLKQADFQESLSAQGITPERAYQVEIDDRQDGRTEPETQSNKYEEIGEANTFAKYKVMRSDGADLLGTVIPNVIDFDQNKKNLKIFVSGTNSSFRTSINGMKIDDIGALTDGDVTPGKFGTFVYEEDGNAIATIPFTIASLSRDGSEVRLKVYDYRGEPNIIKIVPGIERIMSKDRIIYIPGDMKFVELPGITELADKYTMQKNAEANFIGANTVSIISKNNGKYVIRGLDKYASESDWYFGDLDHLKAKFVLMNTGYTEKTAAAILNEADQKNHISIYPQYIKPTYSEYIEKMSQKWQTKVNPFLDKINSLKLNLSKEASEIISAKIKHPLLNNFFEKGAALDGEETVDSVLGLNFLNPDNIDVFKDFAPVLREAVSKLCQLTVAIRLGLSNIKEEDTVKAFKAIDRVLINLKRI